MHSSGSGSPATRSRARASKSRAPTLPTLRPKGREPPADLVLVVSQLVDVELARGQQRAQFLAPPRLHVDGLEPARPHQLGDRSGVVAVVLVPVHRHHRRLRVARLDADDREPGLLKAEEQPLRQGARLKADPGIVPFRSGQLAGDRIRFRGNLGLQDHPAFLVDNTDAGQFQRHVQSGVERDHLRSSLV